MNFKLSRRNFRSMALILSLVALFLTFIFSKIWTFFPRKDSIDCTSLGFLNLDLEGGNVTCYQNQYLFDDYVSVLVSRHGNKNPLKLQVQWPNPTTSGANFSQIFGQIVGAKPGAVGMINTSGKTLWRSNGVGSDWAALTREVVPIQKFYDAGVPAVFSSNSDFDYEFTLVHSPSPVLTSYILTTLSVMMIGVCVGLLLHGIKYRGLDLAIVLMTFAVIMLTSGMPYGSAAGWFDTGDDTSYVNWTYNIGYLLDPNLRHGPIHSWSSDHNHHPWGTGLILAPFLLPARLLYPGHNPGVIHYSLINFGVLTCGLVGVFMFYWAFRQEFEWRKALVISVLAITSTSLLKWTFMRNFFSHAPEFMVFGLASYLVIKRYFGRLQSKAVFWGIMGSLILVTQVRRENVAMFFVPFVYEWLLDLNPNRGVKIRRSFEIMGSAICALIILKATNYWTHLRSFFGNTLTERDFHPDQFMAMWSKQGLDVFFGQSYGLFYWKNGFAWVAAIGLMLAWRKWRIWSPMVFVTLFYLFMCVCFEYPNGVEWQNRFLLKLLPILVAGCLVAVSHHSRVVRSISWLWLIGGSVVELYLYRLQKTEGMNFYLGDLSDSALMYPQSHFSSVITIFYIPLLTIWLVTGIAWFYVYRANRADHSFNE